MLTKFRLLTAASAAILGGSALHQGNRGASVASVHFLSRPRASKGTGLEGLGKTWSYHDYSDTIVIQVITRAGSCPGSTGVIIGDVQVEAGRLSRTDSAGVSTITGNNLSSVTWLPAVHTLQAPLERAQPLPGGACGLIVGSVSPDSLLGELRRSDPDVLIVAMRVRLLLLTPQAKGIPLSPLLQRSIELAMAD